MAERKYGEPPPPTDSEVRYADWLVIATALGLDVRPDDEQPSVDG